MSDYSECAPKAGVLPSPAWVELARLVADAGAPTFQKAALIEGCRRVIRMAQQEEPAPKPEHSKVYEMDGSRHCFECNKTWHQRNGVWDADPGCAPKAGAEPKKGEGGGMSKEPGWMPFDERLGSRQDMPPKYKTVLVYIESLSTGSPRAISVGYRKDAAGDIESPYFVVPGHGGRVLAWVDCLWKPSKYLYHRDEFINYWKLAEDAITSTAPLPAQSEEKGK